MNKSTKAGLAWVVSTLLVLFSAVPQGWSATDTITLTVTPTCSDAIVVSAAPEPYDFGTTIAYNQTTHSTRSITVQNTGTCADTWSLQATGNTVGGGGTVWTAGSNAEGISANRYVLRAAFTSADTMPGSNTTTFDANGVVDDGSATTCTGTVYAGGGATCLDVPATGTNTRYMWFRLELPSSSGDTSTGIQHTITVTLSTT